MSNTVQLATLVLSMVVQCRQLDLDLTFLAFVLLVSFLRSSNTYKQPGVSNQSLLNRAVILQQMVMS